MFFLQIATAIEIGVFVFALIISVIIVRLLLVSRREMERYITETYSSYPPSEIVKPNIQLSSIFSRKKSDTQTPKKSDEEMQKMKAMILQQQQQLSSVVQQLKGMSTDKVVEVVDTSGNRKVQELQHTLEKKDAEIRSLRHQNELAGKMQIHFDELKSEFDVLQEKLQKVESQAWESNELSLKVENLEQTNVHLEKELLRKDEKLSEQTEENHRISTLLNETEDKLQEANNQRMQLAKKVQFLEDMNNDLKQLSETNRKLQNEIRRIGELESMLNLIMQERDELLKRVYQ